MNVGRMLIAFVLGALLLSACGDAAEVESPFSHADDETSEAEAVDRLIAKCDKSGGRFTYACHCEDASGAVLYFEPAMKSALAGNTVYVAIRLLEPPRFNPEEITVCTFWHRVVSAENLKALLAKARTFYELGHRLPTRS